MLLREENLDLTKAVNICRASEIASKQLKSMKVDDVGERPVNAVATQQRKWQKTPRQKNPSKKTPAKETAAKQAKKKCTRCGGSEQHKLEECRAYGQTCHVCKKQNHFASVCRSREKTTSHSSQQRNVRQIVQEDSEESDESLFKVEEIARVVSNDKQVNAELTLSDMDERYKTKLKCQLDTGATCNVMSAHDLAMIIKLANYHFNKAR